MRCSRLSWICLLVTLLKWIPTAAQTVPFTHYTLENGLPQSLVYVSFQDRQGYLWVGTQGGVCRFDGRQFTVWDAQQELPDNHVTAITQGPDGTIWLGHRSGALSCIKNGKLRPFYHSTYGQTRTVNQLVWQQNALWAATKGSGLLKIQMGKSDTVVTRFTRQQGLASDTVNQVWVHSKQQLWLATGQGVSVVNITREKACSFPGASALARTVVNAVYQDSNNTIWYATGTGLFSSRDTTNPAVLTEYTPIEGVDSLEINDMLSDRHGGLWLATNQGVVILKEGHFSRLTTKNGLLSQEIHKILKDREGNIWLSQNGGLSQYLYAGFLLYTEQDGLKHNEVYSMLEYTPGVYWIGTAGGLSLFSPQTKGSHSFKDFPVKKGVVQPFVHALFKDSRGNAWIGTIGEGAARYQADLKQWIYLPSRKGAKDKRITSIAEDRKGRIWLATLDDGVSVFDYATGQVRRYGVKEGFPSARVWKIFRDRQGTLWFASNEAGLVRLQEGPDRFEVLPGQERLLSRSFGSITQDSQGNLWIASIGGGVFRFDGTTFTHYGIKQGLRSNNPYFIYVTRQNKIWLGTNMGVDVFDPATNQTVSYGKKEGFIGIETNQNAILEDGAGVLWIGTVNGLMRCEASPRFVKPTPLFPHFTRQRLFLEDTLLPAGAILAHHQNYLTFDFQAVSLSHAEKIRYRYQLVGLDKKWSPPISDSYVTYTNLPPGEYTLLVMAGLQDGPWNSHYTSFSFSIQPPFWRTAWFISLTGLITVLLSLLAYHFRIQKIRTEEQAKGAVKLQLAELKMEALQAQMNPHFIFNCLNSIQYFIATNDTAAAIQYLSKFARLMRRMLEHSTQTQVKLSDELEMLDYYIALEQLRLENSFTHQIIVAPEVYPQTTWAPPMLIHPFVENAVLHGLKSKSAGGQLVLSFSKQGNYLLCVVEDNGIGRKQAGQLSNSGHKSVGLSITQKRLDLVQDSESFPKAKVQITDLYTADGLPGGTRVEIRIPLRQEA